MKRIVFHLVSGPDDLRDYAPLGFGYLAAFLEKMEFAARCTVEDDLEAMLAINPDVIGLSCASQNYGLAIERARLLRQRTGAKLILGGAHVSCLPESLDPAFHCGVVGEGEDTFHHLMRVLEKTGDLAPADLAEVYGLVYWQDGRLVRTEDRAPIDPLDSVPPPDRSILPPARLTHLMTGRGCPYDCRFCASSRIWGGYRGFSAERVAAELIDLIEAGHRRIYIHDDLFVADPYRLIQVADILEEKELLGAAELSCTVRADLVDDDLCEILFRLGVTAVTFGFESADDDTLERLNKRQTVDQARATLATLDRYGIECAVSAIVGEPEETLESIRATYQFLADEAVRGRLTEGEVNILAPFPGTEYWDRAVKLGLVGDPLKFDWSRVGSPWRGLLLNTLITKEAARLIGWDHRLRGIFAALARPLVLLATDDADLDLDVDPRLVRAIFLLSEEEGVAEVVSEGEVTLLRYGPDEFLDELARLADEYGDSPLVLFAPEPEQATMAVIRACKLGATLLGKPFVRSRTGEFPLMARLQNALGLGGDPFLSLVAGDDEFLPEMAIAEPAKLRELPYSDLAKPVPHTEDAVKLLDRYAAELQARRKEAFESAMREQEKTRSIPSEEEEYEEEIEEF